MHADLVALLALTAGVSCVVDAALPVRPDSPTNDNNDQMPNGNNDQQAQPDEEEFWSHAFSAILSQDASAESQRINPDDWRRYVREAHDLPEGLLSMFGMDAHAEKEDVAQTNTDINSNLDQKPSWNPGHNKGGNRRRFLHVDEIPPLPVEQHPRLLQALTLDDLLDPVAPPPPGAATTSTGNDDDDNDSNNDNRAKVPQPYDSGGGYGNDYRPQYNYDDKDDELNYRWQQGDAEVPGYENSAAGPGGIMTKKVTQFLYFMFVVVRLLDLDAMENIWYGANTFNRTPHNPSFVWKKRSVEQSNIYACIYNFPSSETPKTLPPWLRVGRERNTGCFW